MLVIIKAPKKPPDQAMFGKPWDPTPCHETMEISLELVTYSAVRRQSPDWSCFLERRYEYLGILVGKNKLPDDSKSDLFLIPWTLEVTTFPFKRSGFHHPKKVTGKIARF